MNWKYAIGEVLLIVVGVSIALAASSWYESRQARSDEISSLEQIREALVADLQSLESAGNDFRRFEQHSTALSEHLTGGLPNGTELSPYFSSVNGFRTFRVRSAPFEALKAHGLNLISDDTLRLRLVSLYQDNIPLVQNNMDIEIDYVRSRVLPYFLNNFRRTGNDSWEPKDYEKIVDDQYVANVALYRAYTLRRYALPSIDRTLDSMREVIADIDEELSH